MGFKEIFARISGRDRLGESREDLRVTEEDMRDERITRLKVLEESSRQTESNLRAAKLFEAALVEREKAEALAERRRALEARRASAEDLRLAQIRRDYGMGS